MKNLSDHVLGCNRCVGEWIDAKKVKRTIKELKEVIVAEGYGHFADQEAELLGKVDELVGEKLI